MIRRVVAANLVLLVQYAVGSMVPLLLIPHIVRVIGLTEYGHIAVLMAWGSYAALVVQYAFQMTGPRKIAQFEGDISSAQTFMDIAVTKALLFLIISIVVCLLMYGIAALKVNSNWGWAVLFGLPLAAGLNSVWFLQAQDRFVPVLLLSIIGSIITLTIGFSFITERNSYAVDVAIFTSIFGAVFIGAGTLIISLFFIRGKKYSHTLNGVITSLKEGWHLFISQFVSMLYSASGPIVIGYLLNAGAAGAYSVTERVINALMSAALLTHTAAYPRLAANYIRDRCSYWVMIKLIIVTYVVITIGLSILVIIFHRQIVLFLYGDLSIENIRLLFVALVWLCLGVFGPILTGYLTVANRSSEVWLLNIKVLSISVSLGVPGVLFFGGVGWIGSLAIAQFFLMFVGIKMWRVETRPIIN